MNKVLKILIIILVLWGLIYNLALVFSFDKKYPEQAQMSIVAQVVSMKKEKERSNSYTIKIIQSNIEKTQNTKIIIYTKKEIDLKYGDIVQVDGDFSKGEVARNYKGFNYRNYLKQSKIYGSMYATNIKIVGHECRPRVR